MLTERLYGYAHKVAKRLLRRNTNNPELQLDYYYSGDMFPCNFKSNKKEVLINDKQYNKNNVELTQVEAFYGENAFMGVELKRTVNPTKIERNINNSIDAWKQMITNSKVPDGWRNSGFYLTGYIKEKNQWTLSSWIWTTAAICRYYTSIGDLEQASSIADAFLKEQLPCGGWVVRYDFSSTEIIPMVAPNDSAYIANNALLSTFQLTGKQVYLDAAEKCAAWIMETARPDGLVYLGMNYRSNEWYKDKNIVDIGFTGGLFAKLYEITKNDKYLKFLRKFEDVYLKVFYNTNEGALYTSVDSSDTGFGGYFARGQAWALEGLIPAYRVLGDPVLKDVIENVVNYLIRRQKKDGAWPYNFAKPLMGEDCKGVPVITKVLLDWYEVVGDKRLLESAKLALTWCEKHTEYKGPCVGGIFAYSIEGAVVHDLYTSTAFTYGSSYALEGVNKLRILEV